MLRTIPNNELKPSDIPPFNAEWNDIARFALTFNGYLETGSLQDAGILANRHRGAPSEVLVTLTLTELRICLFFEQRRWKHFGKKPESEDLKHIRSLVEAIRSRVDR